jgi:predicted TIM-barrel fold metal-dependent hydrolase
MRKESGGADARSFGYPLFDADNHYYEPEDAFLRHLDPTFVRQAPRWVTLDDGSRRLVFGDRMNRFVGADQTFRAVGAPGSLTPGMAGRRAAPAGVQEAHPEFTDRDARLALMDRQGLEAVLLFPTLALSVEQLLADDVEGTYAILGAFNRWLDDDWGYAHDDRLYGVPLLSLLDPFRAVEELEQVIGRGARVVHLRAGPVAGRSPADPLFDRFWSAAAGAGVTIAFHAADDAYRYELATVWGWGNVNVPARHIPPIQRIIAGNGRTIRDTLASLVHGGLFARFPSLRLAVVEQGSAWVGPLLTDLDAAGRGELDDDPCDVLRRHVWVSPFEGDDLEGLAGAIGADRMLFGSDFPHVDGLAEPASFAEVLGGFDDADTRRILRDNARTLVAAGR